MEIDALEVRGLDRDTVMALSRPSDAKGLGTKACMDYLATRNDWLRIALPLSNGLFMMTRKPG